MNKKKLKYVLFLIAFMQFGVTDVLFSQKEKLKEDSSKSKNKLTYRKLQKKGNKKVGLFSTYRIDKDYYFEINDSILEKDLLIVNKISKVPYALNGHGLNKGMFYETKLVRFYKDLVNKKIWVKTINPRVKSPEDNKITISVNDNFIESVIEEFDIETTNKNFTSTVIKVNKVFDGTNKSFSDVLSNTGLSLVGSVKTKLSSIEKVKPFKRNVVVKSLITTSVKEGSGPAMPITIGITTNIVLLPEDIMKPRFEDERIGYFSTPMDYYNDKQHEVEHRNLITRWRLEPKKEDIKKYLKGELVEPKKQIVYYIDPATPKQWVPFIEKGVLDWNVAFEAAGFKNAVVVKKVKKNDKDFDVDDVRYSVITYAASEKQNAMGPSVVDPRSGEILEADIIWWHNLMKGLHSWLRVQTGVIDKKSRGNKFSDDHMGEAIRFVSSHEVGHTFGLKHNMGASFAYPVDSLRSPSFTKKMDGTAPSIMDYARYNYVAQPGDNVTELNPKIGVYDKYAINWGYRWTNKKTALEELPILKKFIRKHEDNPLYFYGAQQRGGEIIDPRSQSEDLGDDAVKASEYGLLNLKRIVPKIIDWTYEEGQSYYKASKLYKEVINQWTLYNDHVMANIGGVYLNNTVFGDNKKTYVPVPADIQKKSLDYLLKNAIVPQKWLFIPKNIDKVFAVRDAPDGPRYYSPISLIRTYQAGVLYKLLESDRLMRITENEVLTNEKNTFTQEYLFNKLYLTIFKPTIKSKSLTMLERLTQKNYVDILTVSRNTLLKKTKQIKLKNDMNFKPVFFSYIPRVSDEGSYKRGALTKILKLLKKKKNRGDVVTKNHYADLISRIEYNLKN